MRTEVTIYDAICSNPRKVGKGVREMAPEALRALEQYHWPGNVRELKNEIERAYLRTDGDVLRLLDISPEVVAVQAAQEEGTQVDAELIEGFQRLVEALKTSHGNVSKAADLLGVHRNTVHRWMKRYTLERA